MPTCAFAELVPKAFYESAATSTKVVGASEEKALILYLVLSYGKQTNALNKIDEVDH